MKAGYYCLSACASVRISLSGQIICLNSRNLKLLGTHDKVMARLDIVDIKVIAPLSTNLAYKVKSKN